RSSRRTNAESAVPCSLLLGTIDTSLEVMVESVGELARERCPIVRCPASLLREYVLFHCRYPQANIINIPLKYDGFVTDQIILVASLPGWGPRSKKISSEFRWL